VTDDGAGADAATLAARRAAGFGLSSVERRLERQYGGAATFAFDAHAGRGATVELTLPVNPPPAARAAADPVTDAEAGSTAERRIRLVS
jgi:LytS/YehU family sensor histidine kinase